MRRSQLNGINLYESYLTQTKREQSKKSGKLITLLLPLVLLLLILLGVAGKLLLENHEKSVQIDALDSEIAALSASYEDAQALEARRDETAATYETLSGTRLLFTLYPAPTKELFKQVRDCAAGIFNISQYDFDEAGGLLTINASAASVNEVPQFVQRLRDTGLFSLVQYTGYTSNDTKAYYCTVGCTLKNENTEALDALLQATEDAGAEDEAAGDAMTGDAAAGETESAADTAD